jgi:hypothetical protein
VLLTGLAAAAVWWLGYRMARRGYAFLHPRQPQVRREHRKAA